MSPSRTLRLVLLAVVVLCSGAALAQERWAVQVVALRDFREAQSAAAELRTLGFDAYTEFAMLDSQQWVRVRIGCFTTREAADAMAAALRGRITADAQAAEFNTGAGGAGCTEETIGFINDYQWRLLSDDGPVTFEVTVAGVPAVVAHDGTRWHVLQADAQLEDDALPLTAERFEARRVAGVDFVRLRSEGGDVVVCPGELVASIGAVAIVKRGDHVLACRLASGPLELAGR